VEALVLILIGLITGFEVASSQQGSPDLEQGDHQATEMTVECVVSADALRIANLEDPDAPIWVFQTEDTICDPVSGQIIAVRDLQDLRSF